MKRLTRVYDCEAPKRIAVTKGKYPQTWSETTAVGKALLRLAAYEDTGLEPEEIKRMKECMEPFTIRDIDRFNEIMRAEKDGRLVVLPVKPGTKVYGIGYNFGNYELVERCYNLAYYRPEEFLIATFKTREEAEAALKKRE